MITALLSFYDEDPAWLTRCIDSLTKAQVSHLVCLDGAYGLYPDGKPRSSADQHHAITHAAKTAGLALTLEAPDTVWAGNEIEKRNHLFSLAEQTGADWYMVIDADEIVHRAPEDLTDRLAATPFDVASVRLLEPGHPLGTIVFDTFPMFFRAIPGLSCERNHYTYVTPDGRILWGNARTNHLEPRLPLDDMQVMHHTELRHPDRRQAALAYYRTRDDAGVEHDMPPTRSLLA